MTTKAGHAESVEVVMAQALLRSGYMMESRLVQKLVKSGYFVEPNQRVCDVTTGKSREIDITAEPARFSQSKDHMDSKVAVIVHFTCEAKNNPYPVVLLTELPPSPNLETWDSLHEGTTGYFRDHLLEPSFFDFLTMKQNLFTQYCSFRPRKDGNRSEWIAWHPDDFHDDLEKIVTLCRSDAKRIQEFKDDYHRLFLYIPVVILAGDLYVAKPQDASVSLAKASSGLLMHFGLYEGDQSLSMILFVTEESYLSAFDELVRFGQTIEARVVQDVRSKKGK